MINQDAIHSKLISREIPDVATPQLTEISTIHIEQLVIPEVIISEENQ